MNIAKVLRTKLLFKCQLLLILVLKVKFKTMYKSPGNKNWIKLPIIFDITYDCLKIYLHYKAH